MQRRQLLKVTLNLGINMTVYINKHKMQQLGLNLFLQASSLKNINVNSGVCEIVNRLSDTKYIIDFDCRQVLCIEVSLFKPFGYNVFSERVLSVIRMFDLKAQYDGVCIKGNNYYKVTVHTAPDLLVAARSVILSTLKYKQELPIISPMLAYSYSTKRRIKMPNYVDTIQYPIISTRKMDGIRAITICLPNHLNYDILTEDEITVYMVSRTDKSFGYVLNEIPDMKRTLKSMAYQLLKKENTLSVTFDGELYQHGKTYNEIQSVVMSKKNISAHDTSGLMYSVFTYVSNKTAAERFENLHLIGGSSRVNIIGCSVVNTEAELEAEFNSAIEDNYEGLVLWVGDAPYEHKRSRNLLKYKKRFEVYATIKEITSSTGKETDCAMFLCTCNINNRQIDILVRPCLTIKERKIIYKNSSEYIGRIISVSFADINEYGTPVHAVMDGFVE